MKFISEIKLTVLGKEAKENATTGKTSYSLAVMQGSEAGSITTTEEVFNAVAPLHSYTFAQTYDDKYNYAKITDVDVKTEKYAFATDNKAGAGK